jgi:hypothetical protein
MAYEQWNIREQLRAIDLSYLRETDGTAEQWKAKLANKVGDSSKFQNIVMPVVMPQVEAAVTYQHSVFLSGFPIFGVTSSPEFAYAASQMDAILGEQQLKANCVPSLLRALRKGFKYNLSPVEVDWTQKVSYALEATRVGKDDADKQKEIIWQGNTITDLDPYNTFFDSRVSPVDIPTSGEFAGYTRLMSRIAFKQYLASLPLRINAKEALESGGATPATSDGYRSGGYWLPSLNPEAICDLSSSLYSHSTNWLSWASIGGSGEPRISYSDLYEVVVLYGRILPEDFGMHNVPSKSTPQVWKFVIVNGKVVVYAEQLTNSHNMIPILFCVPMDDGLGYQTKAFAKNVEPIQEITTALANSMIASRRRAISDRLLYDPSRVSAASVRSDSPVARIPVRPSAFGTPMSDAVWPIPFRDDQSQFAMQDIQMFLTLADQISGFNPARKGQFVKGNKTRAEFAEIMGNANGRDQTIALSLEGSFFGPIKEILKANILQYQGGTEVFNIETQEVITVDPVILRRANVEFKLSDGLLPGEKLVDGDSLAMAFQALAGSPQLSAGYNITPMFSYLMKSRGAKLQSFEKSQAQMAYEQAVMAWQQSVQGIIEQFTKLPEMPPMEELQKALPPQPTPEQFGYDPSAVTLSPGNSGKSVYGNYSAQAANVDKARSQSAAPAKSAPQGGQEQ